MGTGASLTWGLYEVREELFETLFPPLPKKSENDKEVQTFPFLLSTLARLNQRIWILIFWARFLLFSIYLPNLSDEEICLASVLMVLTCWQSSEGQSQQWILSCQLDWVNESLLCFPNCNCNLDNGRAESCGEICSAYTIIPSYSPATSLPAAAALPFLSSSRVTAVSLETVQLSQSEFMYRCYQTLKLKCILFISEDLRCASGDQFYIVL